MTGFASSCGKRASHRHGFTLVELLVVIGIIALLISILLPTLGRSREQAMSVKCLSNMKQVGLAFAAYVNDHRGSMPYVERDNSWKPWSATNFGAPNGTNGYQINNVHRHLMKYLGGKVASGNLNMTITSEIYRCPSALDFPNPGNAPNTYNNTSYTFNGVFMRRKATSIRRSAEFIVASESRYAWNVSAMRPYPASGTFATDDLTRVEYRQWMWIESGTAVAGNNNVLNFTLHNKGNNGNVAYLDGHAASVAYKDVRPSHFGLTDSATAGQGLESDTYLQIQANQSLTYRAKFR